MIREICCPIASAAVYPKSLSAPRFHEVMTPSNVLLTIASSEESTIAASCPRSSSLSRRSLMSRATFDAPMMVPLAVRTGDTVSEIGIRRPSLVRRTVSKWSTLSPLRIRASTSSSSAPRSSGIIREMCRPMASSAAYPKSLSAPRFHDVMTPSSVLLTIASSEESTIAASNARNASPSASSTVVGDSLLPILRVQRS